MEEKLKNGDIILIKNADHRIMRGVGYHVNGSYFKVNGYISDGNELMITPLSNPEIILIMPIGWLWISWEYELQKN